VPRAFWLDIGLKFAPFPCGAVGVTVASRAYYFVADEDRVLESNQAETITRLKTQTPAKIMIKKQVTT